MERRVTSVVIASVCFLTFKIADAAPLFRCHESDLSATTRTRSGIYLQWITSLLANQFLRDAIYINIEINTIFLLAVFAATVVSTTNNTFRAAEVIILLHLCFGFLFSILSVWGYRTTLRSGKPVRFPLLGSFFRLTLKTAICAYGLWFWAVGVESMQSNNCHIYTFVFVKVDVQEGIKQYFRLSSALVLAIYGALFTKELLMIACFFTFTTIWTALLALVFMFFSPNSPKNSPFKRTQAKKSSVGTLSFLLKQWIHILVVVFWSQVNGKESAGPLRPSLSNWLLFFVDVWILLLRTSFQFLCSLVFGKCPQVDVPPLIVHPWFEGSKIKKLVEWKGKILKSISYVPRCLPST